MASTPGTTPNLYELQGDKLGITYATSSISGQPQLEFRPGRKSLQFGGTEIETGKTPIGTMVTVTIEDTPDLKKVLFSLLLPDVNLQQSTKVNIKTIGIVTTMKTSISGPNLAKGAVQTYKVVSLRGTGKNRTILMRPIRRRERCVVYRGRRREAEPLRIGIRAPGWHPDEPCANVAQWPSNGRHDRPSRAYFYNVGLR